MKRILITGANSYIGTSFERYLNQFGEKYVADTVDMVGDSWRKKSFSEYDTIFHVAGIAHSDRGKIAEERKALYYRINTQLAIDTAVKAKQDGAGQFIFMSSACVYGDSAPLGKQKMITQDTPTNPANVYGDSKVQAEKGILLLEDESFRVVILRPPMIYGLGSKGNYPVLSKFARKCPMFPKINNNRSVLYSENLCEFVRLMVENYESGIFWPQNAEYANTSEMVRMIALAHRKKLRLTSLLNPAVKLSRHVTGLVDKAFGNLQYDQALSSYKTDYRVVDFYESIKRTEGSVR